MLFGLLLAEILEIGCLFFERFIELLEVLFFLVEGTFLNTRAVLFFEDGMVQSLQLYLVKYVFHFTLKLILAFFSGHLAKKLGLTINILLLLIFYTIFDVFGSYNVIDDLVDVSTHCISVVVHQSDDFFAVRLLCYKKGTSGLERCRVRRSFPSILVYI